MEIKNIEDLKNKSGIYAILTDDDKIYIGSSINIYTRLKSHLNFLNKGTHKNKSLQKSWNINFKINLLEECDEQTLLEKENYYLETTENLHNTWSFVSLTDNILEKLVKKINLKYKINKDNCQKKIDL